MPTVKLRNINPLGQIDLPIAARQGDPFGEEGSGCLEPGEVFEVDAEVAGKAPKVTKDGDVTDPGSGLLAQVGNFELVTEKKKGE